MSTSPPLPPVINPRLTISYEVTRWDMFVNSMTIFLRNRILQVSVLLGLILNGCVWLGPRLLTGSYLQLVSAGLIFLIGYFGFLAVCMSAFGLATAFLLKQRGVVGKHSLEITDQGLVERTDYNETMHKWPSVCRIMSICGYLFIYVGDMNSHQVPKRCFSPEEIANFEAELRARAPHVKSW